MKFITNVAIFGMGLSVFACGATDSAQPDEQAGAQAQAAGEGAPAAQAAAPASEPTQLATFEVGGYQHTFIDNGDTIGITVAGSDSHGLPLVFQLLQQNGELTSLELYLAMAPKEAAVPSRLIEAHDIEASALGRADTAVRNVIIDPNAVVEKGTLTNCKNWTSTKRGGSSPTLLGSTPTANSTLSMGIGTATTNRVAAAICNTTWGQSDSGLSANVERSPQGSSTWTQVGSVGDSGSVFVFPCNCNASDGPSFNSWAYVEGPSASARRFRINGFFLGAGHAYYLAIAY
jgi:hypothetical protein